MKSLSPYWMISDTSLVNTGWSPHYSLATSSSSPVLEVWNHGFFFFSCSIWHGRTALALLACPFPSPVPKRTGSHCNSVSALISTSSFPILEYVWCNKKKSPSHLSLFFAFDSDYTHLHYPSGSSFFASEAFFFFTYFTQLSSGYTIIKWHPLLQWPLSLSSQE